MTRRRAVLVVNPAAHTGTAATKARAVLAELRRHVEVDAVSAGDADGSRRLVAEHARNADAILTLGGDGIAHLAVQELAQGDVPLGVVPAGTGNDIAAMLGWPSDPVKAAGAIGRSLAAGSLGRIDLGRAVAADGGQETSRWWVSILCAGFDSAVNERANRMRWPRGPRRYDVAIAVEALLLRPRRYRLELDGVAEDLDATIISVANGPQYGGGKQLAPAATLTDGHFTVCIVAPVSRLELARLAPKLDRGAHVGHPKVRFVEAGEVVLTADRRAYADGERIGALPLKTHCVPAALPVLLPLETARRP